MHTRANCNRAPSQAPIPVEEEEGTAAAAAVRAAPPRGATPAGRARRGRNACAVYKECIRIQYVVTVLLNSYICTTECIRILYNKIKYNLN